MNAKERAQEIYNQHIALASTDGRLFRKTVMDQLQAELGITLASSATFYNNAKKANPIAGLGRPEAPKGLRTPGKGKKVEELQDDNDCFAVIEILPDNTVGRCQTFLLQGGASEVYDEKVMYASDKTWVMIQGLGPLHGEAYKLAAGEKELKRWPVKVDAVA